MATEKRDVVTNAFVGIAAIILSALVIVGLAWESSGYEREAADRAAHYARNAEGQIAARCRVRIARDHADCVEEAKQTAREYQRKEQDLAAQWVTAWWTKITGAAAVFGVILSAFGVFLVWRTFRAAAEANQIARDTAKQQLRAYVMVDTATVVPCVSKESPFEASHPEARYVHLVAKNFGSTPAHDVAFKMGTAVFDCPLVEEPPPWPDDQPHSVSDIPQGRNAIHRTEVFGSGELSDQIRAGTKAIYTWGWIEYKDIFGDPHTTHFRFECPADGLKHGRMRTTERGNHSD
jgi:hypothetical protein